MLNIDEILKILPHRPPFLLIDRIDEMEPGKRAVGTKCVSFNEPYFAGHFPGMPAQVGAVAILSVEENRGKVAFFGGIQNARFRDKVVPGDVLRLEVEMTKVKGPVGYGMAKAYKQGSKRPCAHAELTFVVQ